MSRVSEWEIESVSFARHFWFPAIVWHSDIFSWEPALWTQVWQEGAVISVTVNFSNFSNFSGNEVFFPMLFNQLKNGFLWNSNFWKIIFYAFQILKRKFLCFSPTWKSYFMVFSLHFRVLNLYFLGFFLQHQHHQQRNENDFSTWVSLSILLLCSVYYIFHKRNENEFSTWVSLGIYLEVLTTVFTRETKITSSHEYL